MTSLNILFESLIKLRHIVFSTVTYILISCANLVGIHFGLIHKCNVLEKKG